MSAAGLPNGTVTFLFTDVEGSTALLHEIGAERYGEALDEHRRVRRQVVAYGLVQMACEECGARRMSTRTAGGRTCSLPDERTVGTPINTR